MCVVHWRDIHGGNVCVLTVHIHSQSDGGRPCNIADCNLVPSAVVQFTGEESMLFTADAVSAGQPTT